MNKFDEVKSKIKFVQKYLRGRSPEQIFGAKNHHFMFNPCLSEQEVKLFEVQHQVALPKDYRLFLTKIGNGGMGPGMGLMPLTNNIEDYPQNLSVPFKHTEAWNYDFEDQNLFNGTYEQPDRISGTLLIGSYGFAPKFLLIITGKEAGNLWGDLRVTEQRIVPGLDANGKHIDFISWYDLWLDKVILKAKKDYWIPRDSTPTQSTNLC